MRILLESCALCGGKISVTQGELTCLSCGKTWLIGGGKRQEKANESSVELTTEVELNQVGEWLTQSDLHEILDIRRLCQNLIEGYIPREIDCLRLTEAGVARKLVKMEPQEEG